MWIWSLVGGTKIPHAAEQLSPCVSTTDLHATAREPMCHNKDSMCHIWNLRRLIIITVMCVYLVTQSCLTLCISMDCSPPGSSVHGDSPGMHTRIDLPCPPPRDLPNPGTEPRPPTLQLDSLPFEPPRKPTNNNKLKLKETQGTMTIFLLWPSSEESFIVLIWFFLYYHSILTLKFPCFLNMMVNFMCPHGWSIVPRYLVKFLFWIFLWRCFLDEVWDGEYMYIHGWSMSMYDKNHYNIVK